MTILAGCDFALEFSHAALLKLLRSTEIVDGQTLRTPFELSVPGPQASAHLIVDEVSMDINGDDTVTLIFTFSKSSVTVSAQPPATLHPLSGTFTLNVRVVLKSTDKTAGVALDFHQCPVSLILSSDSQGLVARAAAAAKTTTAHLTAALESVLRAYLQSRPLVVLPGDYTVTPDVDGTLQPPVFRSLRLRCFGPADQRHQGIGLFGNFFADTKDAGTPANRERSAVPAGQDTLVAISLLAFRSFLWCPQLTKVLTAKLGRPQTLPHEEIPPTCGSATGGLGIDDITVTNLDAFFGQGRIQVNVNFAKSGPCYDATGSMVTYLHLTANGDAITPTVEPQTPNIKVDMDFWCEAAAAIVLGAPASALLASSLEDTMIDVAGSAAGSAATAMTPKALNAPSMPGVQLTGVFVTPDELSFGGRMLIYEPPQPSSELSLVLERKAAVSPETSDGAWVTQLWCQERIKSYSYSETLQTQSQSYTLDAKLIALPLSVVFSVRGGNGPWQKISDSPGSIHGGLPSIIVPALECRYPTPLSAGGCVVVQDVIVSYVLAGSQVTLLSHEGKGNFAVDLRAEVRDGNGQPPPGVDAAPTATAFFESDIVVMGSEYVADLKKCADILKASSEKHAKSRRVPSWKQHFNPFERNILDDIEFLGLLGARGDDMVRHYRNAYADILGQVAAAKRTAKTAITPGAGGDLGEQLQVIAVALSKLHLRQ